MSVLQKYELITEFHQLMVMNGVSPPTWSRYVDLGCLEHILTLAYVFQNFRTRTELEAFIHLTQLGQSEALMFGYRGWRRQWGDARKCGGALVWQLNDCWPTTSWAICDYYLRKKPSYYALARVLAPLAVGVQRGEFSVKISWTENFSDYY